MYNDILRKITSLSLLTILLASSATMALPNVTPAAHAQVASHPNLFVSAENSQYNNYFAGPMVVQVVVADPDINRLDQAYGEPVVTVNGKRLRMAQGTDGNWYGYFADRNQAIAAGNTDVLSGKGLNFGAFCGPTSTFSPKPGVDFTQTKGFTLARGGYGSTNDTAGKVTVAGLPACTNTVGTLDGGQMEHVVRENKTLNTNVNGFGGGSGTLTIQNYINSWPVIQLYDFSAIPTPVTVDYSKAGGDQIVNLTFDRIPSNLISVTADRTAYPENAQVFLTMNDPQLNIDPTEEDSWTWGANANNNTMYYEAFTRNGATDADGSTAMQNLIGNLTTFMFNHNGKFTFNPAAQGVRVVDFAANGKQILNGSSSTSTKGDPAKVHTASVAPGSEPVTFIEQGGVNTGVFGNWDGGKAANIVTLTPTEDVPPGATVGSAELMRGQSATFKYNDIAGSVVGGFAFGTLTVTATNNTWASGQRIPITLTDMDSNKNSKVTEHLNDWDPKVDRMTTMKIGTPFSITSGCPGCFNDAIDPAIFSATSPTFGTGGTINFTDVTSSTHPPSHIATDPDLGVDEFFSNRAIPSFTNTTAGATAVTIKDGGSLVIDTTATMQTLLNTIHNTNTTGTTASSRFHGFNFLNYDLRSFTSLNGATGADPSQVHVYLLFNAAPTFPTPNGKLSFVNPTTGALSPGTTAISLANSTNLEDFINLNATNAIGQNFDEKVFSIPLGANIGFMYQFNTTGTKLPLATTTVGAVVTKGLPIVTDFFSIGITGDGLNNNQRINNAIYRWELEETGDNTGVFTGTSQFLMLNQLNILDPATYQTLVGRTISHDVLFVAIQDMLQSEARAPQATFLDLGQDGVNTQISAQQDIPTHTGVVSFDSKTYKIGDTVTVTVNDQDLNTNNDLVVIYTAVPPAAPITSPQDPATDTIGKAGLGTYSDGRAFGRLLDVQFGQADIRWSDANIPGVNPNAAPCFASEGNAVTRAAFASSFSATGFSLVETAAGSGIFTGTYEVPDQLCQNGIIVASPGQNMKVNYVDFRDDSGKLVEVSDNAGIRGNTGSIKLDKSVYPVPFGTIGSAAGSANFDKPVGTATTSINGVFPMHRDTLIQPETTGTTVGLQSNNVLQAGVVQVHARVNDPDYTTAAAGTNFIAVGVFDNNHGPVAFQISRQGQSMLLATAGGPAKFPGKIVNLNGTQLPAALFPVGGVSPTWNNVADLGPMTEIAPGKGIFQADLPIELTDGPQGQDCPTVNHWDSSLSGGSGFGTENTRFYTTHDKATNGQTGNYCVRQGDVMTVTYFDTSDASGHTQTVTDSATFDLRNGVLQSDKSVYIIGSDMILTLVEPDLNLDSQTAETVPLDVVEWDSHAFKGTMGPLGGQTAPFDAKPSTFVETGKDTGIFQAVIKIPKQLGSTLLERGEQIHLEYTDWGPAGAKTVGGNNQDIELTIYTSNFGATVELDQKVYTWTDRVYITVVAPDHNFDPNLIDIIGDNDENKVTVSTRGHSINYKLTESGVDTGIFTGYVILTGDNTIKGTGGVDGAGTEPRSITGNGQPNSCTSPSNACGPTDGFLQSEDSDGVSVSFEFTRDQTVTGSALIRWNIGEIKWLQPSYPANGQGVLQIVDPDMNLDPKAVDKFDTNVWSDSDSGGIKLTMTETGSDTGIFQGTVYFTTNFASSGNRLHVAEGDTVTGEYKDRTLPPPYTPADQLRLTATTFIGTIVPPLERAPASNPRIVDSFGNAITGAVKVGQQIQITADLANGQDRDQPFAYLVQIQDNNGVTVSLSWITGTLTAGQSLNPAQSWTPSAAGTYNAQIFVWQSIDNPNALSPPLSTPINVQ